jgi:D-3-phosphoglycerate dehydrogenase
MKVLISDPIDKQGVELLKAAGLVVDEKPDLPPPELVKTIPDYSAIIVRSATKVTKEVIEAGRNLKVIGRAGVGLDNVDAKTAKEKGIKVLNTPAATSVSVAELSLGLMLSLARNIAQETAWLKSGTWKKSKGTELMGKTLGIIGVGRIGIELAKRAKALGMTTIAYDPLVKTSEHARLVSLDELLAQSDYISLHVPKTPETTKMLGAEQFKKMKPTAVIINCARGGVVDEDALHDALVAKTIAGAALDVYEKEGEYKKDGAKLKELKLLSLPNVIGTSHVGAQTKEGQRRAGIGIAELVRDALKS